MKSIVPYISIIVPVYKAEAYLHRCVDSLLAQTFVDFEIILIDDGSPDNSGTICDEYAKKDTRIKVIHKENGGVASARQCGIDNAIGIYTIHADPDDWVEPTMLEELYNKAISEDADIVICDFYVSEEKGDTYREQKFLKNNSQKVLEDLLFHKLQGSLWNKLIKLTCYTDFNVRFVENLNYCEDYLVCIKILMQNVKLAYLNKAFYYYDQVINDDSITRNYNLNTYRQRCFFIDELKKTLNGRYPNAILKNEANIAIECLNYNVLTTEDYQKKYHSQKWKFLKFIDGYRDKLHFIIATTF